METYGCWNSDSALWQISWLNDDARIENESTNDKLTKKKKYEYVLSGPYVLYVVSVLQFVMRADKKS